MSKLQLQSSTIIKNKHSSLYAKTTDKQQMALQRYGVDDNLLCLQHMETLYTNTTESTNVKKKPNASHWGLDFHTLQSKFDTLQESFEAIQQDPELTSISYRLKKLEDRTHDDLNDNQLTSWLHNLETLIDNERKAHADEISQIHRKLNNFLLNQQNVKSEPPTSEPQAKSANKNPITISFSTTQKLSMHPQHGLLQLYRDQLNHIIGKHMWDLKHDPEWNARTKGGALVPILQAIWDPDNSVPFTIAMKISKLITKGLTMFSLKNQCKLTSTKLLRMDDCPLWKASEWKQLEAYEDKNTTLHPPESLPNGSNLLSLIWTYMVVKDGGRRKARCVCNCSKNMRGSVTMAETYASALEQTGAQIFWSACA